MMALKTRRCVACRGDEPTVTEDEVQEFLPQLSDWQITEVNGIKRLERRFRFKNFQESLSFTNQVGEIAEQEDHHPLIQTEWGWVTVVWWTHKIKGLHRNDFIMAAKTDELYSG